MRKALALVALAPVALIAIASAPVAYFNPILVDFFAQHLSGGRVEMAGVIAGFAGRLNF